MKRGLVIIATGSITAMVAVVGFIAIMSAFVSPTGASPSTPVLEVALPTVAEPTPAVSQTDNTNYEAVIEAREAQLQAQVEQLQQAIANLDTTSQPQINQLQNQLRDIQRQTNQTGANIESLQTNATALQQAIENDDTTYQNQINALVNQEAQMRQQIEALNTQLSAAYSALVQQQAGTPAAQAPQFQNGGSTHENEHFHHENDDDDDHDDHDDDDDD